MSERRTARVAVLVRPQEHHSLLLYRNAMFARLPSRGISLVPFAPEEPAPRGCAVVWDPGLGMRSVPGILCETRRPVVATVLGLRALAVPVDAAAMSPEDAERERGLAALVRADWSRLSPRVAAVITISHDCAGTIMHELGVPADRVHPIHLAVDRTVFHAGPARNAIPRDYLFHVSLGDAARKNLTRLLAAYDRLPTALRIPLVIKTPQAPALGKVPAGIRFVTGHCTEAELAAFYRGARGLLFPSMYEGFGLPILEALSCGCPVITSSTSACAEVAGAAALLVNPTSVDELAAAMERLLGDEALALRLANDGLRRAEAFSWETCADAHAEILLRVARNAAPLRRIKSALFRR